MIVDFHPEGFQPNKEREIIEKSSHGCCVEIVFGNLTHKFAVTKSGDRTWTVKELASFQDFVDIFCKTMCQMWENPREAEIEDALKTLILGHQAKYGKEDCSRRTSRYVT